MSDPMEIIKEKAESLKQERAKNDNDLGVSSFLKGFKVPTEDSTVECFTCKKRFPVTKVEEFKYKNYCMGCIGMAKSHVDSSEVDRLLKAGNVRGKRREGLKIKYIYDDLICKGHLAPLKTSNSEIVNKYKALESKHKINTLEKFMEEGLFLFLHGNNGTGKTLLALNLAKRFILNKKSIRYEVAGWFFSRVRSTYHHSSKMDEYSFLQTFLDYDLLIIDELGKSSKSEHEINLIELILEERRNLNKKTIVITNLKQDEFAEYLGSAILDRTKNEGKIHFDWKSKR